MIPNRYEIPSIENVPVWEKFENNTIDKEKILFLLVFIKMFLRERPFYHKIVLRLFLFQLPGTFDDIQTKQKNNNNIWPILNQKRKTKSPLLHTTRSLT